MSGLNCFRVKTKFSGFPGVAAWTNGYFSGLSGRGGRVLNGPEIENPTLLGPNWANPRPGPARLISLMLGPKTRKGPIEKIICINSPISPHALSAALPGYLLHREQCVCVCVCVCVCDGVDVCVARAWVRARDRFRLVYVVHKRA